MFGDVVDSCTRNLIPERGVRTSVIVEVDEAAEGAESVAVRPVGSGVGPFVDEGLDEALGLAVGLGPIWSRPLVADAVARLAEGGIRVERMLRANGASY